MNIAKTILILFTAALLMLGGFKYAHAATINSSRSASYFQNTGINSGLIGWWTFDGKDALTDKSGQNQNGTNYGADVTAGRIGQAMSFNGTSDYINLGANSLYELADDVSISAWIYATNVDADRRGPIVSKRHGYSLYVLGGDGSTAHLYYEGYTGSSWGNNFGSSAHVITKNHWHHVALSFKANTYDALYVDGVLVANGTPTGGHGGYIESLLVGWGGAAEWGTPPYFAGKIDDVRVYNRAISPAEIKQLYAMGSSATINKTIGAQSYNQGQGLNRDLVGWWTFDGKDISGTQVYDKSGTGNTGTKVGTVSPIVGKIGQALQFDGASYINVTNPSQNLAGDLTISFWTYPTNVAAGRLNPIAKDYNGEFNIVFEPNGNLSFYHGQCSGDYWNGNNIIAAGVVTDNIWQYFTFTRDTTAKIVKIYKNGILIYTSSAYNVDPAQCADDIKINSGQHGSMAGKTDDMRIYNRAISPAEVKQLYAMGNSATINKTIGTASYQQGQGINSGLAGWWTFDGKDVYGSSVFDKSGNNNTGTKVGTLSYIAGKIGQAINVNTGSQLGQGIRITDHATLDITDKITVSAWVKPTTNQTNHRRIVEKLYSSSWYFGTGLAQNALSIYINNAERATAPAETLKVNKWNHVVFSYNKDAGGTDEVKIYANGVVVATGDYSTAIGTDNEAVHIGYYEPSTDYSFLGHIDDVRVYNRALSPAEIQQLYQLGK